MSSNIPVSIVRPRSYAEAPSVHGLSPRDSRMVGESWKNAETAAMQGQLSAMSLFRVQRELTRLKHRITTPPGSAQYPAPFQFYSVAPAGLAINNPGANYQDSDVGLTVQGGTLAPGGSPTTFNVAFVSTGQHMVTEISNVQPGSYSEPPAYPAAVLGGSGAGLTVSAITPTDAWRTVQMRTGIIGLRSRFFGLDESIYGFEAFPGCNNISGDYGNFQSTFIFGDEYEPFTPIYVVAGNTIMLGAEDAPVIISGYNEASDFVNFRQIVLNAPADGNTYQAGFWLEIHDVPGDSFYVNLVGRMYKDDDSDDAFPRSDASANNVNIVPIAIVAVNSVPLADATLGVSPFVLQFMSGNQINLFDAYFNNNAQTGLTNGLAVGAKACYRGDWTNDALSGQFFYPGDMVTDIPPESSMIGLTNTLYVCQSYIWNSIARTQAPHASANWVPLVQ